MGEFRPFALRAETERRLSGNWSSNAIQAAILFPVFAQARAKARATASLHNLRDLGTATLLYTQDHDERFPPLNNVQANRRALLPYAKSDEIFTQPGTGERYRANASFRASSSQKWRFRAKWRSIMRRSRMPITDAVLSL